MAGDSSFWFQGEACDPSSPLTHVGVSVCVEGGTCMCVYNYSITELRIEAIGFLLCPDWPQTHDPFASTDGVLKL